MDKKLTIYDVFKEKIGLRRRMEIKKDEILINLLASNIDEKNIMFETILLPKVLKVIRDLVHFNYENLLDISKLNSREVDKYLRRDDFGLLSYYSQQQESLFLLVLLDAIYKEKISISGERVDVFLKIAQDYAITIEDVEKLGINKNVLELLRKLRRNNFRFEILTEEDLDLINACHEEYKQEEIYPYLKSNNPSKNEVLKRAEKITFGK